MKTFYVFLTFLIITSNLLGQVTLTATQGTATGTFTTLKSAFDAVNAGTHKGVIVIKINASTTEAASAVLNASGTGSSSFTAVTIYPTVTGLSVTGALAAPLIDLNGADNIVFDGRVNATGATKDLIITNTSTSSTAGTCTIRFINDAITNTVKYCSVKGSSTNDATGVIFFSTTIGTTGNDNNTIDNNDITKAGTNRPHHLLYSLGSATAGLENSGNTVSNNNLFDFFNTDANAYRAGIYLDANNTAWAISSNSIYETTTVTPVFNSNYFAIYVSNTGVGYTVSNNYIGGSAPLCGGTALTKSNAAINPFRGISLSVGTGIFSNIQGNTIANISWMSSNLSIDQFSGIYTQTGDVNIGTVSGNTIGSSVGTGSILFWGAANSELYAIWLNSSDNNDVENNTIGSITTSGIGNNIYGIRKSAYPGGTTIKNNNIGSSTTDNSINASSVATGAGQKVYGIYNQGTGAITISGNRISKLNNASTNTTVSTPGTINGIYTTNGVNTVSNNLVYDLSISNAFDNGNISNSSVMGILFFNSTLGGQIISGNTVYNLSNSYASFTGYTTGIYFSGSGSVASTVSNNFVHDLSVSNSSTSANIAGLYLNGKATSSNNIISLSGNSTSTLYGIYETGSNSSLYYNAVYISGSPAAGALNSYALYNAANSGIRNFRNNIFANTRSNNGATGKHYAIALAGNTSLTITYNDYYVSGTGGTLGQYNAVDKITLSVWKTSTGQDFSSVAVNPVFSNPGGTAPADYSASANVLVATSGTGITTDYAGTTRGVNYSSMGAYEFAVSAPVTVSATIGTLSANYGSLKAAFDAINAGTHKGVISIAINASTTEVASAVLYQSGYGGISSYTSVNVYPTATGLSINGNLDGFPLIELNGANNVVLDGSLNASGVSRDLGLSNISATTTAGTSTIRLINNASLNTVKYCQIKGSQLYGLSGVIFLSTSSGTTGNLSNTFDNNLITNAGNNRPMNGLYSLGTASKENQSEVISNNDFVDLFNPSNGSMMIRLDGYNSAWSVTGNNFYETTSFITTAANDYNVIYINNSAGANFNISNNNIGGSAAACGGTAWTKTGNNNQLLAINMLVATGTASNVQGNTIKNFNYTNSGAAAFTAINITGGDVNVGTVTGNTIGAALGNNSILYTCAANQGNFYGINISSTGSANIQNNVIGAITAGNGATLGNNIYGINKSGAGITIINNNVIGSTDGPTTNSLYSSSASSASIQNIYGINSSGSGTITISGNTISKLTNATTNIASATAGVVNGIITSTGTYTITNNIVSNLSNANANNAAANTASVIGINQISAAAGQSVSGNTIYNLSNSFPGFTGCVIGLYNTGKISASKNFIYGISVTGAGSTTANIYGIKITAGVSAYDNNIIALGGNTTTNIFGIYESGAAAQNNSLYYNTIYLGGSPASGTNTSYCLYSAVNTNTRDFRNNIFMNERSTTGGSNLHYGIYIVSAGGTITCDYNDYYVTGAGSVLGYYGAVKTALPIVTGFDGNSKTLDPILALAAGTNTANYIASAPSLVALPVAGVTTDFIGTTRGINYSSMGAFDFAVNATVTVNANAGLATSNYVNLKTAFDAINAGTHKGVISIVLNGSIAELATATLYQSGYGGNSSYTSVTIYPSATGIILSGNLAAPLIDLNGANNVVIDGRVNATGSAKDLIITNISTAATAGTSTVRFINDASNNTVKFCAVKGSSMDAAGGIIVFSTTTGTTGNDGNTISDNNITNSTDLNRPLSAVYSLGTSAKENSGNAIVNNNIFDLLNRANNTTEINIGNFSTAWSITGNSFYETAPLTLTATVTSYTVISVINTAGAGFNISNNYIGGSTTACGGTPFTKTSAFNVGLFYAINVSLANGTASNINGNLIQNINFAHNSNCNWYGIYVAGGNVNIGTISGNIIGAATGDGTALVLTSSTTSASLLTGIAAFGSGVLDIRNNIIGSITLNNTNSGYSYNFRAINPAGTGTFTVINNTVGSTDPATTNSIISASPCTSVQQQLTGILIAGAGGNYTVSDNTISKILNGTTCPTVGMSGFVSGIFIGSGIVTVTNNTVRDLRNSNLNNLTTANASVTGIVLNYTTAAVQNISGNTIYNLSNVNPAFAGNVIGLYYNGSTTLGTISKNFIYNLSVDPSSTAANIYGIKIDNGAATYANNIMSIGGSTLTNIYGIYENGTLNNNNSLYFNTVYIGGNVASGSNTSYALYSNVSTNTRNFRNNIFSNTRSTAAGSNLHYAAYFNYAVNTGLTLDFNNYTASGTGGVLGYYNTANVNSLPLVSGNDAASISVNPGFLNAGGTLSYNYIAGAAMNGAAGTGITTDFFGSTRSATPKMGAWEIDITLPITLASFTGQHTGVINQLKWITATEINNKQFELERSTDGLNFIKIATIASKGNSSAYQNYIYDDAFPLSGLNYYRLRQVDFNGHAVYSDVISINSRMVSNTISVYPNPTSGLFILKTTQSVHNGLISVTDLSGSVVMKTGNLNGNTFSFDISKLSAGIYIVLIRDTAINETIRIIKK